MQVKKLRKSFYAEDTERYWAKIKKKNPFYSIRKKLYCYINISVIK